MLELSMNFKVDAGVDLVKLELLAQIDDAVAALAGEDTAEVGEFDACHVSTGSFLGVWMRYDAGRGGRRLPGR